MGGKGKRALEDIHPVRGVMEDANDFYLIAPDVVEDVVSRMCEQSYWRTDFGPKAIGQRPVWNSLDGERDGVEILICGLSPVVIDAIIVQRPEVAPRRVRNAKPHRFS